MNINYLFALIVSKSRPKKLENLVKHLDKFRGYGILNFLFENDIDSRDWLAIGLASALSALLDAFKKTRFSYVHDRIANLYIFQAV